MSMELAIAMKALKEAKNLEGSIEDVVRKYMEENPVTIDDTLTKTIWLQTLRLQAIKLNQQ